MKKIKLLVPSLALAAVATTIAPLATSCTTAEVKLNKIELNTDEVETEYYYGDTLNTDYLKVNAVYSDGSTKQIPLVDCEITPALNKKLTCDDEKVTIKYDGKVATYDINVYEDIDNYQFRGSTYLEDMGYTTATLSFKEANQIYWNHEKLDVNLKDDVFFNLHTWCNLANTALKLEASGEVLTPVQKLILTYVIEYMLGASLDFVGVINQTEGIIKGLDVSFDASKQIAYVSADITLRLEADMVDRMTDPTKAPVKLGDYVLSTNFQLKNVPYKIAFWNEFEIIGEGLECFGTVLDEKVLQNDTNWSITRTYTGIATRDTGGTEWSSNRVIYDSTYVPAEQTRNFLQFQMNYFEGCKHAEPKK